MQILHSFMQIFTNLKVKRWLNFVSAPKKGRKMQTFSILELNLTSSSPGAPTRLQNYDCSRLCFTFSTRNHKNLPKKFQKQQQLWNFLKFSTFLKFFHVNFCVTSWMSIKTTSLCENQHEICEFHGTFLKNCAIFSQTFSFSSFFCQFYKYKRVVEP